METNGTAMRHVSANTEAEQLLITLLQSKCLRGQPTCNYGSIQMCGSTLK